MLDHLLNDLPYRVARQQQEIHNEHRPKHINLQKFEASTDRPHRKRIGDSFPDLNFTHRRGNRVVVLTRFCCLADIR